MNTRDYITIMIFFCFCVLSFIVAQPAYPPEKYVQWFVKASVLLDDMGYDSIATVVAQKLPLDETFQKTAKDIGFDAKRFEVIAKRDLQKYHRDIEKKVITNVSEDDLIYLIWLLNILQNKIQDPTLMETLHVIIQKHWKDSKKIEKKYPKIFDWYKKFRQAQGIIFTKRVTGKGNEVVNDIIQTKDLGYIIVGTTDSIGQGRGDVIVIKHDKHGNWLWTQTFGGPAKDIGMAVAEMEDGNLIFVGTTWSTEETRNDAWVIKTDAKGKKIWSKTYGTARGDEGLGIITLSSGEILIFGLSPSDSSLYGLPWIFQIDQEGKVLWQVRIPCMDENTPKQLIPLAQNEMLLLGSILHNDDWDIYLLRFNTKGEIIWEQRYGGPKDDRAVTLVPNEKGLAVLASTNSWGVGSLNIWLLQLDMEGKKTGEKILGGQAYNYPAGLAVGKDQAWTIAGYSTMFGSEHSSSWLVKLDSSWNMLWNKNMRDGQAKTVFACQDRGFVVAGERTTEKQGKDVFLIKTDPSGKFEK